RVVRPAVADAPRFVSVAVRVLARPVPRLAVVERVLVLRALVLRALVVVPRAVVARPVRPVVRFAAAPRVGVLAVRVVVFLAAA
ncbi:hypothetical protein, partial [Salmonella enterica]|uniref:hypothetical protein n=1 Tax=Salmonella enterica TaxID=28901 RepID=UPI003D29810A